MLLKNTVCNIYYIQKRCSSTLLLVRLPGNSRLLVVMFWRVRSYTWIFNCMEVVVVVLPLTCMLFRGQLYCLQRNNEVSHQHRIEQMNKTELSFKSGRIISTPLSSLFKHDRFSKVNSLMHPGVCTHFILKHKYESYCDFRIKTKTYHSHSCRKLEMPNPQGDR